LAPQLGALLGGDDPALRRLTPPAYLDDPQADEDYQALMANDLLAAHRGHLEILAETAQATELDEEQLLAWMRAVNALRLVLGTRLDVSEDQLDIDADDSEARAYALYGYLGWLLEHLVAALAE
jgi:hypothetical protein